LYLVVKDLTYIVRLIHDANLQYQWS
jgi:hypothetical protein